MGAIQSQENTWLAPKIEKTIDYQAFIGGGLEITTIEASYLPSRISFLSKTICPKW